MLTTPTPTKDVAPLPLGPHFKRLFAIESDTFYPQTLSSPPPQDHAPSTTYLSDDLDKTDWDFCAFLKENWLSSKTPSKDSPQGDVEGLLDELVAMALPQTALELVRSEPWMRESTSFATQLAIGVAAMMAGDPTEAEFALRKAQSLMPEEPAPYVNLAQIFIQKDRIKDAEIWLLAGLEAQPNHHNLWELLYQVLTETKGDFAPEELLAIAQDKSSWAGTSLATSLVTTGDRHFKATQMEKFFHLGERDPLFLIELTGAYGIAQEFEKIPPLLWQAEKLSTKVLPWQLHAHGAQAETALGCYEKALAHIKKARKDRFLSESGTYALLELEQEIILSQNTALETPNPQMPPL